METIYIDSLFLINFIINYFLLLASAKVCGRPLKRLRFALGAAFGGLYSVLVVLPGLGFLAEAPIKLVAGVFMVLIAFGGDRRFLRSCVVFFAISAAFGGAVYAASMLGGLPRGEGLYVPVSLKVLVLSFAVCYVAVSLVFSRAAKRAEHQVLSVDLTFAGRSATLHALRDTGNELCDPVSGKPVMVAERESLSPLFPPEAADALSEPDPAAAFEALGAIPCCAGRLRLVPYTAVGVGQSLLLAFRPDSARIDGRESRELLVALSPTHLCEDGRYSAIL